MSRIGRTAICSRCYEEKVIVAEFSGSETERLYCGKSYTDIKNACTIICGQKLPYTFYNNHLQESHMKQEMAKLISDFKEKEIFE
jgi:ribosomal protein S27AE